MRKPPKAVSAYSRACIDLAYFRKALMVFSSPTFLFIFLPAVFILNLLLKPVPLKNALLIIFSLVFYAWGEPVYVLLMIFTTLVNYLLSRLIKPGQTARI